MDRIYASLRLFCAISLLAPPSASAVTIDTVPVGNPGNAADTTVMVNDGTTGYGSVAYAYRIGKYEVTNAQYAEFLNAKAKSDPLDLYNTSVGGGMNGITRSGSDGGYTYATINGRADMPVNFVNWYDAIRFVNWLNNGQGSGDTETGAYTLTDSTITRNPRATWFLPSENEWYKAAYHKNDGVTGDYFRYPTSSDTAPGGGTPPGGSNSANYLFAMGGNLTDVGAYSGTTSPYGAFDMAGNVWEWNEALNGSWRGLRGGSINYDSRFLQSSFRSTDGPTGSGYEHLGFRVASVPQPPAMWNVDADGNWSLATNWDGSVPNWIGAAATFGSVITAPRTVTVDAPVTAAAIKFDSGNSYTIVGPSGLTLNNFDLGTVTIETTSGSHLISAPLTVAALNSLTKTGAGTLTLSGPLHLAPGTTLTVAGGTFNLNVDGGPNLSLVANATANLGTTQHLACLALGAGAGVNLTPGGGKLIRTSSLSLDGGALLDLADGKLILDGDGNTRAARLLQTRAAVATGAANLTWTGPGIASSAAAGDADHLTALGVMLNDDGQGGPFYTTFAGETVDANAVLVRYTYYGDADLSGSVNGTDYALIDNGFNSGRTGWLNGDFDYSGHIDGTDYALIDNAFNSQSGPLGGLTDVPEPSSLALAAMGLAIGLLGWNRRKGH